jgi:glycolate oxidase FAD binding subunit
MSDQRSHAIPTQDCEADLLEQVRLAQDRGERLHLLGTGTKAFYGNPVVADRQLDCSSHRGLIAYEPSELAITLRAGTRLDEVEALLAAHGQQFPFEPPHFGALSATGGEGTGGTLGGMVASGLSGPRRPYSGSLRDALLGVKLLNAQAEVLNLGGRVMKNVAGYDLSRLMAGALGVLGVLLEVSLKVIPIPPASLSLVHECPLADALGRMRAWARRPLPISASAWVDGRLCLRLSGSEEALTESQRLIGGSPMPDAEGFWAELRDQRLAFFAGDEPLWRLSVNPAAPASLMAGDAASLIEWGGALRWIRGTRDADIPRAAARAAGGHATLFRAGAASPPRDGVFTPLDPVNQRLHQQLKQAFDPGGIFNPGRLYADLSPPPAGQAG